MDSSTHKPNSLAPDSVKLDPGLPPSSTPAPTAPGSADTPVDIPPTLTRTFNPTSPTASMDPAIAPPLPQLGTFIDGYEILEIIGRGGMGVVFKVKQPNTEQTVALKMIRDLTFADQEWRDRFVQEIKALGRVQPARNIIPIFHVGAHNGEPYYVMPFFANGSMSKQVRRIQGERRHAVALVEKVARAVHGLHEHQIIHRDIKPSNVFLDEMDEPHLGDFGLAKILDAEQSLTGAFHRLGTPHYMAPEQTGLVASQVGPACDIWALGVLLYELTVGSRPFTAPKGEESSTLLYRIVNDEPPSPRTLKADLDPGLEAVIIKCLEKRPEDRFASAADLADELARWLQEGKVRTAQVTPIGRFARRYPWTSVGIVAATMLLVVGAVAAVVALDMRRRQSPEFIHETLRTELLDKGTVVLVPDSGKPAWFQPVFDRRMITEVDRDGYWRVDVPGPESEMPGLVELLRDIPFETFKIRAEMRHLSSGQQNGRAGLFVAHRRFSHEKITAHAWLSLGYNDIVPLQVVPPQAKKGPLNLAQLRGDLYWTNETGSTSDHWTAQTFRFVPMLQAMPRWRVLEMELRADRIVCSFDGNVLPAQDRARLENNVQSTLREKQARDAKYLQLGDPANVRLAERGSVGILVCNGSILLKNVTLTRIP